MSFKISVYITSYNQKAYLIEAIESVLNQTLRPFEIIIVDGCSTDGSQEVIERYALAHPNLIIPIYHKRNLGISRTRSDALEHVQGDLVTYLDGDDRFLPQKLEIELKTFINHPEAQIVYSNVYYIDADGRRIGLWADDTNLPPSGYVFREVFSRAFPQGSLFRNELVAYSCFKKVGFYDSGFQIYEDWELKIRLTKQFKVAYCHEPLVEYRLHSGGLSKSPAPLHLDLMKRAYKKNSHLLEDLPKTDRLMIEKGLSGKYASLAQRSAIETLKEGDRKLALKYWLESLRHNPKSFDFGLAAQLILPPCGYRRLKDAYRGFRDVRR